MAKKKIRADQALLEQDLVDDLSKAQALIMAGKVFTSKEEKILTAGQQISLTEDLYIKGQKKKYVGRGAYKLEKALQDFDIDVSGKIALDVGASTGGFTDLLLQRGAEKVYALDVGTNQLDWSLRQDERVIVMEQTNFRYAEAEDFQQGEIEFACIDVSFISLTLIFPALSRVIQEHGEVVALIKPQFEAEKEDVGEHGVVTDPAVHRYVIEKIIAEVKKDYVIQGLTSSPIRGHSGNREFLIYLRFDPKQESNHSFQTDWTLLEQ